MKQVKLSKLLKLEADWAMSWSAEEKLAWKRILSAFGADGKVDAMDLARRLLALRLTSLKKDLSFLGKLLIMSDWKEPAVNWIKKKIISESKAIVYNKRDTKFPDSRKFRATLSVLLTRNKIQEVLFLACALASGRRGVELERLMVEDMDWVQDTIVAKLPWSKTSLKPICFKINFDLVADWLQPVLELSKVKETMRRMMLNEGRLFRAGIHKNFGRNLDGFNLHSLRSVSAVFMVLAGRADADIMSQLGCTLRHLCSLSI